MKSLFIFVIFILPAAVSAQPVSFTLKGRVPQNSKAEKLYLNGEGINVQIPLSNKKEFFYDGALANPAILLIKTDKSYAWTIWPANGTIEIVLDEKDGDARDTSGMKLLKVSSLTGPAETEKYQWLIEHQNIVSSKFRGLSLVQWRDSMAKYYDPVLEEYIVNHPNSRFSAVITRHAFSKEHRLRMLALINKEFTKEEIVQADMDMKRAAVTAVGSKIEDFNLKDIHGDNFTLSMLSSKYILLDFWASWCAPCRSQHPDLLKVYGEFKPKGFEIVAISLDDEKTSWQQAVEIDKLNWIHVSDLGGWESSLAKKYYVNAVPFNILLDEDKTIIATNLTSHLLKQKLLELLD